MCQNRYMYKWTGDVSFNKGSRARTDIIYISAEQQKGTTKDVLCAIGLVIV